MKHFVIAVFLLAGSAYGTGLSDLLEIADSEYKPTARDPFVDASVSRTLLSPEDEREVKADAPAPPIDSYRQELITVFRQAHDVNGIAMAGGSAMAIVDGKIVQSGETLSVALSDDIGARLAATSKSFGLGLESQMESKMLTVLVDHITPQGLYLRMKGMTAAILLEYRKNFFA